MAAATDSIYAGLYYPIAVALIMFVVGSLLLKETVNNRIWTEFDAEGGSEHYAAGEPTIDLRSADERRRPGAFT